MAVAGQSPKSAEFAEIWQAAEKVIFSRGLESVSTKRTRIERSFDAESRRTPLRVLNAAVLWTTRNLDAAVEQLRALPAETCEHDVLNEDVARLSPLKHANLNVLGRSSFRASTPGPPIAEEQIWSLSAYQGWGRSPSRMIWAMCAERSGLVSALAWRIAVTSWRTASAAGAIEQVCDMVCEVCGDPRRP